MICCRGCDLLVEQLTLARRFRCVSGLSLWLHRRTPITFFLSMGKIRDRQGTYTDYKAILESPLGSVVRGENGLYRVDYGGM